MSALRQGAHKANIEALLRYSLRLPVATAVVGMPKPEFLEQNVAGCPRLQAALARGNGPREPAGGFPPGGPWSASSRITWTPERVYSITPAGPCLRASAKQTPESVAARSDDDRVCYTAQKLEEPRMTLQDYKTVLYRQEDGSWVAEIPSIPGCYALMPTREGALAELSRVFEVIAEEYREKGLQLPADTTEIVHA